MIAAIVNLFVNSTFSLLAGFLVVQFFCWLFRIENGDWKLFFLSLPFVKILFDLYQGVPENSLLATGVNPFQLPDQSQSVNIGFGFDWLGPSLKLLFSARDVSGREYSASFGDYFVYWTNLHLGTGALLAIFLLIVTVSFVLIIRRLASGLAFEWVRRQDRAMARPLECRTLKVRKVDIYISDAFTGTPFTGGVLFPYICFPVDSYQGLDPSEVQTVVAHEMGHIRQFDVLGSAVVQLLGDLLWFVPGYRFLSRKIDRLREITADQWVIASGQDPLKLASALVKVKEHVMNRQQQVAYSAFVREKNLLKVRVEALLHEGESVSPRFGWSQRWVRVTMGLVVFSSVMMTNIGGNHGPVFLKNPSWLDAVLTKMAGGAGVSQ